MTTKVPGKNANDSRYQFYDSVHIPDDETRPNTARRSRPRAKQSDCSKSTDSTKFNPGTPPDEKGPMLLKTVEDAIQRLIVPELNVKHEKAQLGRRFTGEEVSRYMSSC